MRLLYETDGEFPVATVVSRAVKSIYFSEHRGQAANSILLRLMLRVKHCRASIFFDASLHAALHFRWSTVEVDPSTVAPRSG
jgi:hypothetical protein